MCSILWSQWLHFPTHQATFALPGVGSTGFRGAEYWTHRWGMEYTPDFNLKTWWFNCSLAAFLMHVKTHTHTHTSKSTQGDWDCNEPVSTRKSRSSSLYDVLAIFGHFCVNKNSGFTEQKIGPGIIDIRWYKMIFRFFFNQALVPSVFGRCGVAAFAGCELRDCRDCFRREPAGLLGDCACRSGGSWVSWQIWQLKWLTLSYFIYVIIALNKTLAVEHLIYLDLSVFDVELA